MRKGKHPQCVGDKNSRCTVRKRNDFQALSSAKAVDRWRELGVAEPVLDHFTTSWLSSPNCYWYQGASPFPVTCEALESEFHAIKRVHSLREKMKFEFFNKWLQKTIQVDWIEEKDAISTEIPQPLYSEAYSLSLYGRSITGIEGTDEYLMPSESAGKIKIEERLIDSLYSSTYKTFEDYAKTRFQVYHLRKTGPKTFSCTCKFGSMKKPCKHAVYLACSLQLDSYPEVDAAPGRGVEVIRVEPR
uniref:SWIM-type domain-containing protein n=1 Tax=Bursaphelenchus xylophilus TaxID=6326 RepID=A0A1I7SUR9_BURXY